MAMQFWEAKRRHTMRTAFTLCLFFLLTCAVAAIFEWSVRMLAQEGYMPPMPYLGIAMAAFICLVAGLYYLSYAGFGGKIAAESMGGVCITLENASSKQELQLLNIVEELAIASRTPVPPVYLIAANEINAFAAGLKPTKSIIAVTTGALKLLNREELQGVIAHEFGHIANGDMRIGMRLAALLMGFFIVFYFGLRLLEGSFFIRDENRKGNSVALIALLLLASGALLWFAGSILRACVSREREYLADASSVEYTRNPDGIASALRKIKVHNEEVKDMPKSGLGYAHLYFDNRSFWFRLFATHPPLDKRIAAIEGKKV